MGKVTLADTSIDGPAFSVGSQRDVLAWTGIDPAHSVNVWVDVLALSGSPQKGTLAETSLGGPGVCGAVSSPVGELLVAWTGADAHHHLNNAQVAA